MTAIKNHRAYRPGMTLLVDSSYGDFKYSRLSLAAAAHQNMAANAKKGGAAVVKMTSGHFVVTCNRRASVFEKQGSGAVLTYSEIYL